MKNKCVICGFDKKVELHHLQKHNDYGSNAEENLVYLCPNHHWIADFGDSEDKKLILKHIKKITGKTPQIDYNRQRYFEKLIRAEIEFDFGYFSDEEYDAKFKNSQNYQSLKKFFLNRQQIPFQAIERAELKHLLGIIRKKLYYG